MRIKSQVIKIIFLLVLYYFVGVAVLLWIITGYYCPKKINTEVKGIKRNEGTWCFSDEQILNPNQILNSCAPCPAVMIWFKDDFWTSDVSLWPQTLHKLLTE